MTGFPPSNYSGGSRCLDLGYRNRCGLDPAEVNTPPTIQRILTEFLTLEGGIAMHVLPEKEDF